jgi:RNA polymerase sigma factor (TIGR02999 family)
MSSSNPRDVTVLLAAVRDGDDSALEELTPLVYQELRKLAGSLLRKSPAGQTLRTTALVHEAYVKLVKQDGGEFEGRGRFYAFAAKVMRNVLVDYARERKAAKRGAAAGRLPLDEVLQVIPGTDVDVLDLNEALERLAAPAGGGRGARGGGEPRPRRALPGPEPGSTGGSRGSSS